MKLCRFNDDRLGIVQDGRVCDVTRVLEPLVSDRLDRRHGDPLLRLLPSLRATLQAACDEAPRVGVSDVKFRAPVADPPRVIAVRTNYRSSASTASGARPPPDLFLKASTSVVGPGDGVALRFPDRRTDHEVELVAVIGERATNVHPEQALECVAGYCVGIDFTLRGDEDRGLRKSLDGYTVLGPWLTTADEAGETRERRITLSVNGGPRQAGNTSHMLHDVAEIVAAASRYLTLLPGDVIMTGTPDGVGPVRPGDVIECAVEGLGEMRVSVEAHPVGAGTHR